MRTNIALLIVFSLTADRASAQRPRDPWLFHGALEGRPGMVFLALHKQMTVAYDRKGCSLFEAWKGAAVPETGPSPAGLGEDFRPAGAIYHKRTNPAPWSVTGPKGNVPVTVRMAADTVEGEQARLEYVLSLPGGKRIRVRETPEFDDHYGDNALFRNFEVTGIPAGMALRLEVDGRGMTETWGGGAVGRVEKEGTRYFFIQELDGETPIKVTWSGSGDAEKK